MRIFALEYITGGALAEQPLPPRLLHEAQIMIGALVRDLAAVPGAELLVARDARLAPLPGVVHTCCSRGGEDLWQLWGSCLKGCDALWPLAPETGGTLERLSRMALDAGRALIGSAPEAVALTASKLRTVQCLQRAGVRVVPTYAAGEPIPAVQGRWVLKPDDGWVARACASSKICIRCCGCCAPAIRSPGRWCSRIWPVCRPASRYCAATDQRGC